MKRIFNTVLMLALTTLSQAAFAHPGHGQENPLSPGHYIANPVHFIPLALAVTALVAFVVIRFYRVRQKK